MVSLRSKIIASLILMSFISIALTVLGARNLILQRFDQLAQDPVADAFVIEVTAYYNEYGSWEAAIEAEQLFSFVSRLRATGELPPPIFYPENQQPFVFLRGPDEAAELGVEIPEQSSPSEFRPFGPPGPPGGFRGGPLPEGFEDGPPPPPPPYMILDETGRIILSPIPEDMGKVIQGIQLDKAIPVVHQDQVIGYLYSDLRAALSEQEDQYLLAINDSWWIALILAAVLSIPVGIMLGRRVAGPIDSLDRAIRAMQPGALDQKVQVKSNDELGQLTHSFNQMSKDLSYAYDELEKSRQKMEEMSLQDPLTELPNRRSFDESAAVVMAQAYRHSRPCVLAMIDVDGFKQINDSYSHATGDKVLKLLSGVLQDNLREVDIIARYGGEEFLVLFPETDLQTAYQLMERLREFIAEHRWPNIDEELKVTVSAGLVEVDVRDTSPNVLDKAFNAADKKLYAAKANGRNRTEC